MKVRKLKNRLRGNYMNKKTNFIKTSDPETKQTLIANGFKLLYEEGAISVFINNPLLTFDALPSNVNYTNTISI